MAVHEQLNVFLNPKSVAVIGATERPGSWGSFIMQGLLSGPFPGRIYPVNPQAEQIFGVPAFRNVKEIPDAPELAVFTIPEPTVEQTIRECGEKGVKGISIITAGFGEAVESGKQRERELVRLARSFGMRLLGPNVSGTFNLHAKFNASAAPVGYLIKSPIAGICQGSYAIYDLLAHGFSKRMGLGMFVQTGNEADLTITDFLEYVGADPHVQGVMMYIEGVKDGRRFADVVRKVAKTKPVIVYKAGKTPNAGRAAQSHTGALAGSYQVYEGVFEQSNIIDCPTMELLLPLSHALVERPAMHGKRVAIVTMGGSWGVALTDALEAEGLSVPILSDRLQSRLRELGMPVRASVRNPVDIGASGLFLAVDALTALGREVLASGEVDALILHGMGRPGLIAEKEADPLRFFLEINKTVVRDYAEMEKTFGIPVMIGSVYSPGESQMVYDLNQEGIRIFDRLDETAQILSRMARYWDRRGA